MSKKPYRNRKQVTTHTDKKDKNKLALLGVAATAVTVSGVGLQAPITAEASELGAHSMSVEDLVSAFGAGAKLTTTNDNWTTYTEAQKDTGGTAYTVGEGTYKVATDIETAEPKVLGSVTIDANGKVFLTALKADKYIVTKSALVSGTGIEEVSIIGTGVTSFDAFGEQIFVVPDTKNPKTTADIMYSGEKIGEVDFSRDTETVTLGEQKQTAKTTKDKSDIPYVNKVTLQSKVNLVGHDYKVDGSSVDGEKYVAISKDATKPSEVSNGQYTLGTIYHDGTTKYTAHTSPVPTTVENSAGTAYENATIAVKPETENGVAPTELVVGKEYTFVVGGDSYVSQDVKAVVNSKTFKLTGVTLEAKQETTQEEKVTQASIQKEIKDADGNAVTDAVVEVYDETNTKVTGDLIVGKKYTFKITKDTFKVKEVTVDALGKDYKLTATLEKATTTPTTIAMTSLVSDIKDEAGKAITGATIRAKTATNNTVTELEIGKSYTFEIEKAGYMIKVLQNVEVTNKDFKLEATLKAEESTTINLADIDVVDKEGKPYEDVELLVAKDKDGKTVTTVEIGQEYTFTIEKDGKTFTKKATVTKDFALEYEFETTKLVDVSELGLTGIKSIVSVKQNVNGVLTAVTANAQGKYDVGGLVEITYIDAQDTQQVAYRVISETGVKNIIGVISKGDIEAVTKYTNATATVDYTSVGSLQEVGDKLYVPADATEGRFGIHYESNGEKVERFPLRFKVENNKITVTVENGFSILTTLNLKDTNLHSAKEVGGTNALDVLGDLDTVALKDADLGKIYEATISQNGIGLMFFKLEGTTATPTVTNYHAVADYGIIDNVLKQHNKKIADYNGATVDVKFETGAVDATKFNNATNILTLVSNKNVDKKATLTVKDANGNKIAESTAVFKSTTAGYDFVLDGKQVEVGKVLKSGLNATDLITSADDNLFVANLTLSDGVKAEDVTVKTKVDGKDVESSLVTANGKTKVILKEGSELKEGVHEVSISATVGDKTDTVTGFRVLVKDDYLTFYKGYVQDLNPDVEVTKAVHDLIYKMSGLTKLPAKTELTQLKKNISDLLEDDHPDLYEVFMELLVDLGDTNVKTEDPDKKTVVKHTMTLAKLKELIGKDVPKEVTQDLLDKYYDLLYHNIDPSQVEDAKETATIIVDFLANLDDLVKLGAKGYEKLDELISYIHPDADLLDELYNILDTVDVLNKVVEGKEVTATDLTDATTALKANKQEKHLTAIFTSHIDAYTSATKLTTLAKDAGIKSIVDIRKNLEKVTSTTFKAKVDKLVTEYMTKTGITEDDIKKATSLATPLGKDYKLATNGGVVSVTTDLNASEAKIEVGFKMTDFDKLLTDKNNMLQIKTKDGVEIQVNIAKLDLTSYKTSLGADAVVKVLFEKTTAGVTFNVTVSNEKETKTVTNLGSFTKVIIPTTLIGLEKAVEGQSKKSRVFRKSDSGNIGVLGKMVGEKYELFTQYGGTFVAGEPIIKTTIADLGKTFNAKGIQEFVERGIMTLEADGKFAPSRAITNSEAKRALVVSMADGNEASIKDVLGVSLEEYLTTKTNKLVQSSDTMTRENAAILMHGIISRYDKAILDKVLNDKGTTGSDGKKALSAPVYNDANSISAEAKESVAYMQHLRVMIGKPGSIFDPKESLTKAQLTKIVGVTMNKLGFLDNESIYSGE